jgi:molybdopterin converting factor small subunit
LFLRALLVLIQGLEDEMKLLGGTYGEGDVVFLSGSRQLRISSKGSYFSPKFRPISEIKHFEDINNATTGSLGKAGVGAAAGFLLAGPLAGIIGLGLGASGGISTKFVFGIGFSNGDAIMVGASANEYMSIKSAITPYITTSKTKGLTKTPKHTDKTKQTAKKSAKPSIIDGREKKSAPSPTGSLVEKISKSLSEAESKSNEYEFFKLAEHYKIALNDFKWRYFDQLLSEEDVKHCLIMTVSYAHYKLSLKLDSIKTSEKYIETLEKDIKKYEERYEEESKKFFGSFLGSQKAELADLIRRDKDYKAHELEEILPDLKQSAEEWKSKILVFENIVKEMVGENLLSVNLKKYINHQPKILNYNDYNGPLSKSFGLKFFANVQNQIKDSNEEIVAISQEDSKVTNAEARLEQLNLLLKKKLITEVEYNQKRESILSDI